MFSFHRSHRVRPTPQASHRRLVVEPLERREMLSVSLGSASVAESGGAAETAFLSVEADPALAAPSWIRLDATGPTQVQLEWSDVEGEDGYYIYTYQNGASVFLASVGPGETQFTARDLAPGQTHHFLIQAHNDDGLVSSPWQNVTTIELLPVLLSLPGTDLASDSFES